MGLKTLEWHEQKNDGWVARSVETFFGGQSIPLSMRYAHVNIYPWHIKRVKNKVFVEMQRGVPDHSWHDSIEAAKLYVEAIFALDND
jgi:hypothetical protein